MIIIYGPSMPMLIKSWREKLQKKEIGRINIPVGHSKFLQCGLIESKKRNSSGYTNTDFNQYLKECFFGYCIGNLSVTHIASQLSFHLHRICEDDLQKNFLIGKQVSHQPDLAYGGFSYKQLNDSYEKYVWLWFQNKHESHVLDRPQFIQAKSDERVGSQRAWSFNQAKKS